MKLRVGVIGTGFGSEVQIPVLTAHPRARVVAVASGTAGKAATVARRFGIPQAFDDYRQLVKVDLDLVSVTAPPHLHHAMTMAALGEGRRVICEKPMALHSGEAVEMLREAERRGVAHVIDHQLRFNPNRRAIRSLITGGFIGHPRHALVTAVGTGWSDPNRSWTWWSDAARGGGTLGATGSHQIDLLRYWLGEVEAVSGTVETYVAERPAPDGSEMRRVTSEDVTAFSARLASGAVAVVLLSAVATHPMGTRVEIWGDEGALILDREERLWGAKRGQSLQELTEPDTLKPPPGMQYSALWGLSFVRLVDHLVPALLDGSPIAPAATFGDGLQVQRVMDAVRASARSGWVRVASTVDDRNV